MVPIPAITEHGSVRTIGEAQLASSSQIQITISLVDDAWVPTIGSDVAVTGALLSGFRSQQSELSGWNSVIQPKLAAANTTRVDDTLLTVQVSTSALYSITEPET